MSINFSDFSQLLSGNPATIGLRCSISQALTNVQIFQEIHYQVWTIDESPVNPSYYSKNLLRPLATGNIYLESLIEKTPLARSIFRTQYVNIHVA